MSGASSKELRSPGAALVDVVGAAEPPAAFAMPRIAPLQPAPPVGDPAAGHPAAAPDSYRTPPQKALADLAPRTGARRDPHQAFTTSDPASAWGRSADGADPHRPILTSGHGAPGTPAGTTSWAPPDHLAAVEGPRTSSALQLGPAEQSGLFGQLPAQPGDRSLGALCRACGWGLVTALVLGCLSTWLAFPALLAGWYFAWRHPLSRTPLLRAFAPATAAVLMITVLGSPTRSAWGQLGWASWIADICLLAITLLVSDRRLIPHPADTPNSHPGDGRGNPRR